MAKGTVLTPMEILPQVTSRGWSLNEPGTVISKTFTHENFLNAVNFINRIAVVAEARDHHPDLFLFGYNKVQVKLSTHSAAGVTIKDIELSQSIDELQ